MLNDAGEKIASTAPTTHTQASNVRKLRGLEFPIRTVSKQPPPFVRCCTSLQRGKGRIMQAAYFVPSGHLGMSGASAWLLTYACCNFFFFPATRGFWLFTPCM